MKQNWWQVMLYSYDDLGGDPWFEIAIATNRISLDMFKLCDPKLISSTVPLLLKVKVKGLTHKRGVDCGDACGPCYREGGKSHPKNMQFFPYMSILFASYLFVGFCLSLCWYSHDIVSYFGVSSDPWYYTYISTFFILSICLDLPNLPFCAVCQGWFIAKVDFKQVFNHVMRGQSIVIWDGVDGCPHLWRDRTLGQGLMWPEVRIRRAIDLWHGNTRCCRFPWLGLLFFSVTVVLGILVETPIPFRWWHFLFVVSYPKVNIEWLPIGFLFFQCVFHDGLLWCPPGCPLFQGLTKSSQLVLLFIQRLGGTSSDSNDWQPTQDFHQLPCC